MGLSSAWEVGLQVRVRVRLVMVTEAVQVCSDQAEPRPGQAVRLQVRETQGRAWPWAHW